MSEIKELQKTVTELQVECAKQSRDIHHIVVAVDGLSEKVEKLCDNMLADQKRKNSFLNSALLRIVILILSAGGVGAVAANVFANQSQQAMARSADKP